MLSDFKPELILDKEYPEDALPDFKPAFILQQCGDGIITKQQALQLTGLYELGYVDFVFDPFGFDDNYVDIIYNKTN